MFFENLEVWGENIWDGGRWRVQIVIVDDWGGLTIFRLLCRWRSCRCQNSKAIVIRFRGWSHIHLRWFMAVLTVFCIHIFGYLGRARVWRRSARCNICLWCRLDGYIVDGGAFERWNASVRVVGWLMRWWRRCGRESHIRWDTLGRVNQECVIL